MRLHHSFGLPLLLIVLGSGWTRGADSPSVSALKEKGLTRSGITFVIEAEKPVLAKMKEARAVFAGYAAVAERQAVAEQVATRLTQLEQRRVELQNNLNDLNQQINEQGYAQANNSPGPGMRNLAQSGLVSQMIAQRNLIRNTMAEVSLEQNTLNADAPQSKDRTAPDEDVKKKAEACKASLAELRPRVDEVTKKYADLGADVSVKAAISSLEKETKANLKLGPSDAFKAAAKTLDQAERKLLGKKTPAFSRKKGKSKK
jgi:prefoldin subunit 5